MHWNILRSFTNTYKSIFINWTVFQRLIDFVNRLKLIKGILATNLGFSKLEKVEFGGIEGRLLSQKGKQIFDEFGSVYNVFNNIQYDPCDIADNSILKDNDDFLPDVLIMIKD